MKVSVLANRPPRQVVAGLATAALVASLSACGGASSSPSSDTRTAGRSSAPVSAGPDQPQVAEIAKGLASPWGLVPLADGSLLVSQRDNRTIVHLDGAQRTTVATLDDVDPGGEGGLLGLAAAADAKTVFAYYTANEDNRIVSMSWDGTTLGPPRPILQGIPQGSRHNGGRLVVGPDDLLYVGTGDSGDSELAQDKSSLGGKILRLTQAGRPAPGNPFGDEIFSYGHRNVQGLAFDDQDRLWASEFGDQTWDELNLINPGGNYGWPLVEGSGARADLINPKLVWPTSEASPSGLAFWQGELWMAALRGGRLWEIPVDGTTAGEPRAHFSGAYGRLRSVTVAADGESLILSTSNTDGRGDPQGGDDKILRITR